MAKSRAAYYREVLDQILSTVGIKLTEEQRMRPPFDALRKRVDGLPGERLLTAGVADFWLDLGPKLGPERRKDPKVPSPFWPVGRQTVGKKDPIAAWDDDWRKLAAAEHLATARTGDGQALYEDLIADRCPWFLGWSNGREAVIGHACWLPVSFDLEAFDASTETFDIHWLRPVQALKLPWDDTNEARCWMAIVRECHRSQEAELERIRLELDTGSASGDSRKIVLP